MLKEIKCEKFSGKIKDKTIHFHDGLNCVVGADDALNSIGKTNLLMLVDFCFGGEDYVSKGKDIIDNIGNHLVCFAFEFDSKVYYFERDTAEPKYYFECNNEYQTVGEKKPIKDFQAFLKEKYFNKEITDSFRSAVNGYSRIYGKNNYDVSKPLKTFSNDTKDESGIAVLVDLFGKTSVIKQYKDEINEAKNSKKAFDNAKKYGFIYSPLKSQKDVDEVNARIEEIKKELDDITQNENQAEIIADERISLKEIDLKSEQVCLMREKRGLSIKLNSINAMTGDNLLMDEDDLVSLKECFPDATIKNLIEINDFQKQLSDNVNEEINEQKAELSNKIKIINDKLKEINDTLLKNNVSPRISKSFLETVIQKNEEIKKLKGQIEQYKKSQSFKEKINETETKLNEKCADVLPNIQKAINDNLVILNDAIYLEKRIAPSIQIKSYSKYSYKTPNDKGTGTEYKSLILFDLTILDKTQLPFAIHDSILFKNIWDEPVEGLFRIYDKSKKQIFVAIDRISVFSDEIRQIINKNQVVKLGEGENALYGFVWAKSKSE